jgi:hypothetical protein
MRKLEENSRKIRGILAWHALQAAAAAARMDKKPHLSDYLMISSLNWIVGICAGTVISLSLSEIEIWVPQSVGFGLTAVVMLGVSIFAYQFEVKRQNEETGRLEAESYQHQSARAKSDNQVAQARGLRAWMRTSGPADHIIVMRRRS